MFQNKANKKKRDCCLFPQTAVILILLLLSAKLVCAEGDQPVEKRDPFVPLVGVAPEKSHEETVSGEGIFILPEEMKLQGIVTGVNGEFNAFINGEIVKKGDKLGNILIEDIAKNTVVVNVNDKRYILKLYE
ncbi:MAG: hypothetical protein ABH869_07675 [Candidatus Omnitrophota bacterium]